MAFQAVEIAFEKVQIVGQSTSHSRIVHAQKERAALRIEHPTHHLHEVVSLHFEVGAHVIVGGEHSARLKLELLPFDPEGIALWEFQIYVQHLLNLLANVLLLAFESKARGEVEREDEACQLCQFVRRRILLRGLPQKIILRFIAHTAHEENLRELFAK